MVGFRGGLSRALENRFEDAGVRFYSSASTSAGIRSFASSDHLEKLLSKLQPDAVILTLGTNNMTVPYPEALKGSIASIAKRIAPRDCYWIGPPSWKPDAAPAQDAGAALVLVLEEATLPCKFFDSSKLQLERQSDGVHPTNLGGEKWADAFWLFWLAH